MDEKVKLEFAESLDFKSMDKLLKILTLYYE